jgi:hypothetical protein
MKVKDVELLIRNKPSYIIYEHPPQVKTLIYINLFVGSDALTIVNCRRVFPNYSTKKKDSAEIFYHFERNRWQKVYNKVKYRI